MIHFLKNFNNDFMQGLRLVFGCIIFPSTLLDNFYFKLPMHHC
jgi:hypothetical protein